MEFKAAILFSFLATNTPAQTFDAQIAFLDINACTKDGHLVQHFGKLTTFSPSRSLLSTSFVNAIDRQITILERDFQSYASNMTYPKDFAPADQELAEKGYYTIPKLLQYFSVHSGNRFVDNVTDLIIANARRNITAEFVLGDFSWSKEPHEFCLDSEGPGV